MASANLSAADLQPASATQPAAKAARLTQFGWPALALGFALILQFSMIFTRAINWDEFFYFHEVAAFSEGYLARPLQTIHVRLFAWLPPLAPNSVDAIVTARLFMMMCEAVTLASLFWIARHFFDTRSGIWAALLYVTAGYVLQHGTSFRVDPMLAASLMAALAILATSRLRWPAIVGFAALCGFAGMVSMKAVLFAPAFAGIAWLRWEEAGRSLARLILLATCALAALASFALLYWWHAKGLAPDNGALSQGSAMVGSSGSWVFFFGIPPYWQMALKSMAIAPILYGCMFAAPLMIAKANMPAAKKIALACLWLPITSIFFYTNTAAYFYAFILPPVVLAALLPLRWLLDRYGDRLIALVLIIMTAALGFIEDREVVDRQRQVVTNVQEIFPERVTYLDDNFMLGAWDKGNGLMTPWGMAGYYANGQPAYRRAMEQQTVPLIIANSQNWQDMLDSGQSGLLLPDDEAAVRANFRLHSWPLWVAGKSFAADTQDRREEFLVPGPYTVSGSTIILDGREYAPGSIVEIARGDHTVTVPGSVAAALTWGENLPQPSNPVEPGPLHVDF